MIPEHWYSNLRLFIYLLNEIVSIWEKVYVYYLSESNKLSLKKKYYIINKTIKPALNTCQ